MSLVDTAAVEVVLGLESPLAKLREQFVENIWIAADGVFVAEGVAPFDGAVRLDRLEHPADQSCKEEVATGVEGERRLLQIRAVDGRGGVREPALAVDSGEDYVES